MKNLKIILVLFLLSSLVLMACSQKRIKSDNEGLIANDTVSFENKYEEKIYRKINQELQKVFNRDRYEISVTFDAENPKNCKKIIGIVFLKQDGKYSSLSKVELESVEKHVKEIIDYNASRGDTVYIINENEDVSKSYEMPVEDENPPVYTDMSRVMGNSK